jgi:hypothetical protein
MKLLPRCQRPGSGRGEAGAAAEVVVVIESRRISTRRNEAGRRCMNGATVEATVHRKFLQKRELKRAYELSKHTVWSRT